MEQQKLGIQNIIDPMREEILRLAHKRGASNLRVFGSVARGEATSDSDVDFLVDFAPNYRLLDHVGLMVDLKALLNRNVDVAVADNLREEFRDSILREAIPI